jgi:hypothetical protein
MERPVSDELMAFHRQEQMQRLKGFLGGKRKEAASEPVSTPVRGSL